MVTASYPPSLGGVERHVARLSESLVEAGHKVDVLSQDLASAEGSRAEQFPGLGVHRFRAWGPANYAASPALLAHLRGHSESWDIVHVHNYHRLNTSLAPLTSSIPVIVTPHYHGTGNTAVARQLHRVYRPLGAWSLYRASSVIAVSQAESRRLLAHFPGLSNRIVVIPNGVDPHFVTGTSRRKDSGWRSVLVMGRLEPYKGLDRLLESLPHSPSDVRVVVCGDGPDRGRLQNLVSRRGLQHRVLFCGRVTDDVLERWVDSCQAVVSLSSQEAFGLSVAEALVSGVPVACSDIPAHRELMETAPVGAVTLVAARTSPIAVAAAVRKALDKGRFDANTMGLPNWAEVARRVADVYEQAHRRVAPRR
jgi:glycosyltransferase involved in cell wall biosynthesis